MRTSISRTINPLERRGEPVRQMEGRILHAVRLEPAVRPVAQSPSRPISPAAASSAASSSSRQGSVLAGNRNVADCTARHGTVCRDCTTTLYSGLTSLLRPGYWFLVTGVPLDLAGH